MGLMSIFQSKLPVESQQSNLCFKIEDLLKRAICGEDKLVLVTTYGTFLSQSLSLSLLHIQREGRGGKRGNLRISSPYASHTF